MKNKISALIAVGLISVSGLLVFADSKAPTEEYDPSLGGGCIDLRDPQCEISPEQLDAMGVITNITKGEELGLDKNSIVIRVELPVDENAKDGVATLDLKPEARYEIADVIVNKDTFIEKDGLNKVLKVSDLKKGQNVEVKFVGPESRSYPVQANADIIKIISEVK